VSDSVVKLVKSFETTREAALVVGENGVLQYVSDKAAQFLACDAAESIGVSLWDIAEDWQECLELALEETLVQQGSRKLELYFEPTESWFELTLTPRGDVGIIVLTHLKDNTDSRGIREQVQSKLKVQVHQQTSSVEVLRLGRQHDSLHDLLTGLYNRFGLIDILEKTHLWQNGTFLLLDVDHFHRLNDSLGPAFGDALLVTLSERFFHTLRPDDLTARLGGDEFAVFLRSANQEEARFVAERLQRSLEQPFFIQGSDVAITVSVGILGNLGGYETPQDMLRDADLCLDYAKRIGNSSISVFDPALREELLARLALEQALKEAVVNNELEVYYQPIFDLRSDKLVGLEALSRWHRQGGAVSPATFIALAEESRLILDIDKWVLERACQQLSHWERQGLVTAPLNINVSASHFAELTMAKHFESTLQSYGVSAKNIHLELTETVLMDEGVQTQQTLQDLQHLGINLHIDDFGTGYASLNYLQRFCAHGLKIDRSFIADLKNPKSFELIRAIIAMAHALNMKVVAEGIETSWQKEQLEDLGCDYGQGYLLSKPLPAKTIETMLQHLPDPKASSVTLPAFLVLN
jgi:diguanylate cyclase (GGDEF)-like protein